MGQLPGTLSEQLDALVPRRLFTVCAMSGSGGSPTCVNLNCEAHIASIQHIVTKHGMGDWAYADLVPLQQLHEWYSDLLGPGDSRNMANWYMTDVGH